MESSGIKSVLRLDKVVFDKIEFKRIGFKSDKEFEFSIESNISKRDNAEFYRSTLVLNGCKQGEYEIEISITGFFFLDHADELQQDIKSDLMSKNTVAIRMPYLRSYRLKKSFCLKQRPRSSESIFRGGMVKTIRCR